MTSTDKMHYRRMDEGGDADFDVLAEVHEENLRLLPDHLLGLLDSLGSDDKYPIDRKAHSLQAATRARRDGLDPTSGTTTPATYAAAMSATDNFIANRARILAEFEPTGLPASPAKQLVVVACMDARLDPVAVLGLRDGDAHIIRNAGGVATDDVLRSLALSQRVLGTEEIVLFHHTDCGLEGFDEEAELERMTREAGEAPPFRLHAFTDLDGSVRATAQRIRECPWLPSRDRIRGFVFDVESGRLREVDL